MKHFWVYNLLAVVFVIVLGGVLGTVWYVSRPVQAEAVPVAAQPIPAQEPAVTPAPVRPGDALLAEVLKTGAAAPFSTDQPVTAAQPGSLVAAAGELPAIEYTMTADGTLVPLSPIPASPVPASPIVISPTSQSSQTASSGSSPSTGSLASSATGGSSSSTSGTAETSSDAPTAPASPAPTPKTPGAGPGIPLAPEQETAAPDWILQEGIRAGFFPSSSSTGYEKKMRAIGLNTAIPTRLCYDLKQLPQIMKDYAAHAQASALMGMHMFAAYVWQPGGQWTTPRYRSVVFADGTEGLFPCPLDETFWQEHLINIAVNISVISLKNSVSIIDGIFLDMEMYGTEALSSEKRYYTQETCFCDDCFARFILDRTELKSLPPVRKDRRKSWLDQYDYLPDYNTYLQQRVEAKAEELRLRVHAINPQMLLGVYPRLSDENWALTAVMRGFGKNSYPAISFTTDTYGYYPSTTNPGGANCIPGDLPNYFEEFGINGVYAAGYLLQKYTSSQIGAHLINSCQRAEGYWLFSMQQLLETTDAQTEPLAGGSQDDYLRAIKNANSALGTN